MRLTAYCAICLVALLREPCIVHVTRSQEATTIAAAVRESDQDFAIIGHSFSGRFSDSFGSTGDYCISFNADGSCLLQLTDQDGNTASFSGSYQQTKVGSFTLPNWTAALEDAIGLEYTCQGKVNRSGSTFSWKLTLNSNPNIFAKSESGTSGGC